MKEQLKLYREPCGHYLLVFTGNGKSPSGKWDCVGSLREGRATFPVILASSQVSPEYLRNRCRRVQWDDLPLQWQEAFATYWGVDPN